MGFVTTGKLLTENHPFFRAFGTSSDDPDIRPQVARVTLDHANAADEDDDDSDHDDEEYVHAIEHVDDSEGEDEKLESEDDLEFVDARDGKDDHES
jgi:hypothetical protein